MKNIFLILSAAIVCIALNSNRIFAQQQTDKEIIKSASLDIKDKDYELAFNKIVTVADAGKKKPQAILKKSYPNVILDNTTKANNIKVIDKEDDKTKIQKLEQIVSFFKDNIRVDSLFKKTADPDLYKSLSKKKKIDNALESFTTKLNNIRKKIELKEAASKPKDTLVLKDTVKTTQMDTAKVSKDNIVVESAKQDNVTGNSTSTQQSTSMTSSNSNTNATSNNATSNSGSVGAKYFIIAGSFKSQQEAQSATDALKAKGYASEVVGQNAYGNYRICYNSFKDKAEATKELEHIRTSVQADAWLLEK